jgi:GTPase SAR1 family protein
MQSSTAPKFLVFGVVGKGKSTLLNLLTDGPLSKNNRFKTSSKFDSCTLTVEPFKGKIYGTSKDVELYDIPGLLGMDVNLETWKKIIDTGFSGKFNAILWVVSAIDRPGVPDALLRQGMEFLLESFSENNVILVLTHCDLLNSEEPIDSMKIAKEWVSIFNKGMKTPVKLTAALAFGTKQTSTFIPNYHQELANIVDNYKTQTMGIQKDVNFEQFGECIMNAVHPKLASAVESLLKEQLSKKEIENAELRKEVFEANKERIVALAEAGKPNPLATLINMVSGGLDICYKWKRLNSTPQDPFESLYRQNFLWKKDYDNDDFDDSRL